MSGFQKIALASTFSPRFLPLLAEAQRFAARLGGTLSIIHAGARDEQSEQLFQKAFADFGFDPAPEILWQSGSLPDQAIFTAIREARIDLLVLGALEREVPGRSFLGNVARSLMRSAPCPLLFLTKPEFAATRLRTIVLMADDSAEARLGFSIAKDFAERDGAARICVASVLSVFHQARVAQEGHEPAEAAEERRLQEFVAAGGPSTVKIDTRCIESTTGFAASEFVNTINADLLIVPSSAPGGTMTFPPGMDWILDTIPTNLLLLRPT